VTEQQPVARPVYALEWPASKSRITTVARALKVLHGPDLKMLEVADRYVWYTPGTPCDCDTCTEHLALMIDGIHP